MDEKQPVCAVCGASSSQVPLLALEYREQRYWICPQDMPQLIHHPENLVGKLPGADQLKGYTA